jgi:hypothetical protein
MIAIDALKGHDATAQGAALGIRCATNEALKGRDLFFCWGNDHGAIVVECALAFGV